MKTKMLMSCLVAGAMILTSCSKKIDEKTMSEINTVGTDMTAMGDKAMAWSQELNTSMESAKTFAMKQQEMMTSMAPKMEKDANLKMSMENSVKMANEDVTKFETIANEWNSYKPTWDEMTKSFGEWKEKVMKGEVSAEDAMKGLADFKTKMNDAQMKMDNWNTAYAAVKSSCDKNMASADEMMKTMESAVMKK